MANSILAKMAVEISANTAKFNQGLAQASAQTKSFERRIDSMSKSIKGFGLTLLAGFGITEVIGGIIRVTSEFQKFEAVLTNTLGDNSRAQSALQNIRDFAVRTPFEVSELTAAYVRWTNAGLNPTISTLQKLGDVASSLGFGFEETAEAFKDLAVGQTKRIENIGITATQANGKIQLSFKGVNIEVEKNIQGVQQALDVYSQLQGVIGSTEAVSKTLAGSVSNLKDAWDNFLLTVGSSTNIFTGVIKTLTNLLTAASNFSAEIEIRQKSVPNTSKAADAGLVPRFQEFSKATSEYILRSGQTQTGKSIATIVAELEKSNGKTRTAQQILEDRLDLQKQFQNLLLKEGENITQINGLWKVYIANIQKRYDEEYIGIAQTNASNAILEKNRQDAEKAEQEAQVKAEKEKEKQRELQQAINDKIKEEADAWKNLMKQRSLSFEELKQQYKEQQTINVAPIDTLSIAPQIKAPDLSAYVESLKPAIQANDALRVSVDKLNESFAASASEGLQSFFVGLGDVANKQISFGDNLLKAIAGFMKQFGEQLIALGVAKIGLDNLFATGIGGPAAIAAGVALVAAAGAISKKMANQTPTQIAREQIASEKRSEQIAAAKQKLLGGIFSNTSAANNIQITGKLVGSGRDLIAVINNTSYDNTQRKGG